VVAHLLGENLPVRVGLLQAALDSLDGVCRPRTASAPGSARRWPPLTWWMTASTKPLPTGKPAAPKASG